MESAVSACRHHWIIEAAAGPTSRGRCKRCGEERQFTNSLPADSKFHALDVKGLYAGDPVRFELGYRDE